MIMMMMIFYCVAIMFFKHHRKLVILFCFFNYPTRRRWLLCLETVTLWPSGDLSRPSLIPETEGGKKETNKQKPFKIFPYFNCYL